MGRDIFNLDKVGVFGGDPAQERMDQMAQQFEVNKSLQIVVTGDLTLAYDGSTILPVVASITHNLGYPPAYMAFMDNGANNRQSLPSFTITGAGAIKYAITAFADSTTFQAAFQAYVTPGAPLTVKVRYFLFREPAATS